MKNIDDNVFYESARGAREEQEIKDLKYQILLLKKSLKKTIEAKDNANYKKDNDIIDQSIISFKNQIEGFEKRIKDLLAPSSA